MMRSCRTIPSWYLVGRQDELINPDAQRFMAKRAHARTVEIIPPTCPTWRTRER